MVIIVGLGNPGKKYNNTAHNIGFDIVDKIAQENDFPEFRLSKPFILFTKKVKGKKLNALLSKKDNIILLKPQTFMNNSGETLRKFLQNSKFKMQDLIVIHDDIDLILGKIKVSKNSGSAGHKGAESIIRELGTKDFTRIRIGIQPEKGKPTNVEKYVLQKLNKEQKESLDPAIQKAIDEIKKLS